MRDRAVTRGFAVALKDRIGRALPEFRDAIAEKPPWMRGILQAFGNGVREADQEFWVRALFEWWEKDRTKRGFYNGPKRSADVLLVPDVRYLNEVAAIKARGGKVIKVVRWHEYYDDMGAGEDRPYRAPGVDSDHPSEALLDTIPDTEFNAIFNAQSGETRWLELCIEERLQAWGLVARNDGGMGDDI